MSRNYSNKNLTQLELGNIEFYLNQKKGYSEIGRILSKDESTIRKEVKKYSSFFGKERKCSHCLNKEKCHQKYLCENILDQTRCSSCKYCSLAVKLCPNYAVNIDCELLKKNHHVCNGCELLLKCKKVKIRYHAETAVKKHQTVQRVSQMDLKIDSFPEEFKHYIANLIKRKISPEIILHTLPEKFSMFKISVPTLYNYINKGLLDCCNLDLRNKVSRVRYGTNSEKRNTVKGHQLNGRSIENLTEEERNTRPLGIVEIDTVEGIKGGHLLFTIMIPAFSLMLAFKIKSKTQKEIIKQLDHLEEVLEKDFYVIFRKVIPDNGVEFLDFNGLEKSVYSDIKKRFSIHYTHTYASYEKPHVENNHILLRWLIQKGADISKLSDEDVIDIINRLNSYPRIKFNFKTPLQLFENYFGAEILSKLNLKHIPLDELDMNFIITKK